MKYIKTALRSGKVKLMPPIFLYIVFLALMKCAGRLKKGRQTAVGIETAPLWNLLSLLKLAALLWGFLLSLSLTLFVQYYLIFTPKRKEILENRMGIVFTDDVKPVKYSYVGGPDSLQKLCLTTDKSGESFAAENIAGEITNYTADGIVYTFPSGKSTPLSVAEFAEQYGYPDGLAGYYIYRYKGRSCKVLIYAKNKGCKIEIIE